MTTMPPTIARFRELHARGCFVIPNPWDGGSAKFLHHLGFHALATTSAGYAFSRGLPDRVWALSLDDVLAHCRDIAAATPLPVSCDFQSGFARDLEGLQRNVAACVATGVAGLSIEDATGEAGTAPLYDRATAIARVKAARAAIDATGVPVVLTARCEAFLVGERDAEATVLDRVVAFVDAGADCVFAPRADDPAVITRIVKAVAPVPVNVVVTGPGHTVAQLADLGVRRISVGSALARTAWGGFIRAATRIRDAGDFAGLGDAATFAELDALFGR